MWFVKEMVRQERRMAPRYREEPFQSNFRALCKGDRIVDIRTQIANGILDV